MPDVIFIAEDGAQERFVGRLIARIASELTVQCRIRLRTAIGGFPSILHNLHGLQGDLRRGMPAPDAIVVAADANCRGFVERRNQIDQKAGPLAAKVVHAIPDPHVERWFLLDGTAFKRVVGKGCDAPDCKCEKDRYKRLLREAIDATGKRTLIGGTEYAEDLAGALDLARAAQQDDSLRRFIEEWRDALQRLKTAG